jgi:hypothetical protein
MFIIGTGRMQAFVPPRYRNRDNPSAAAAALAAAEHALDVHLGGGLGEREIGRPETDTEPALEEPFDEVMQQRFGSSTGRVPS